MKSIRKGFTLVELMVVIVIIGILAALAIPRFLGATNKTKATEFKAVVKQIYTLEEAYRQESSTGAYGTLAQAGWDKPSGTSTYFGYGTGTNQVLDAAAQTTEMNVVPAGTIATAVAANNVVTLVTATPMTATGQNIKGTDSKGVLTALVAGDQGCVNTNGGIFVTTDILGSLTGASAPVAKTPATCQ